MDTQIEKLASSEKKIKFGRNKRNLVDKCIVCKHLDLCRGGCPKDRRMADPGYGKETYLCEGYKKIFDHITGKMWEIAAEVVNYQ